MFIAVDQILLKVITWPLFFTQSNYKIYRIIIDILYNKIINKLYEFKIKNHN